MVEELEEFLDTGFNRGELNLIQAKICTVGKFHGPYHQNNGQNIVPNKAQNNGPNNPQNIVHNNAQFEIQNHPPNAQNYVTRDEFAGFKNEFAGFKNEFAGFKNEFAGFKNEFAGFKNEFAGFKESINVRFDRLERSIQALGGRNLNNEERKRKKEKKKKMR